MDNREYMDKLKVLTDSDNEALLEIFLDIAKQAVILRLYPFSQEKGDVPDEYSANVLQIAVYLYDKQGAEGQTAHSENGISRSYESGNIPESMFCGIVPYARII